MNKGVQRFIQQLKSVTNATHYDEFNKKPMFVQDKMHVIT